MVTVAPILVVLGAGYVMGIFVLLIENVPVETYWNSCRVKMFEDGDKMNIEGCCTINTLRTGDSDLRFYITTVQDGW